MKFGFKLLELRKKEGLSQEELAYKLDVTRQTISKWELNETSPDIMQAKKLSKIFSVSLDELVDNDIKDILTEKISNTEALAALIIKILKIFGVISIIVLTLFMLYKLFFVSTYAWFIGGKTYIHCKLGEKDYSYEITYIENELENSNRHDKEFERYPYKISNIQRLEGSSYLGGIIDIEKYECYYQFIEGVYGYFEEHGGSCD